MKKKKQIECVHSRHCTWDSCKYGEEDCCPVYLGYKEPDIKECWESNIKIIKPTQKEFKLRRIWSESCNPF